MGLCLINFKTILYHQQDDQHGTEYRQKVITFTFGIYRDSKKATVSHKNSETRNPFLPYSMLAGCLLAHSWLPLPGIAIPDLAQY